MHTCRIKKKHLYNYKRRMDVYVVAVSLSSLINITIIFIILFISIQPGLILWCYLGNYQIPMEVIGSIPLTYADIFS